MVSILFETTKIDVSKTVGEIQGILAGHGAESIQVNYLNREAVGLAFIIDTPFGLRQFALPAHTQGVYKVMAEGRTRLMRDAAMATMREQANKTAWRILREWVAVQMAIIDAGMATMSEIMFPYMIVGETTVYEAFKDHQLSLPGGD